VLLSILPLALVHATVGPGENTFTLFLVIEVFTFVAAAISPRKYSTSVHLVVIPKSVILTAVAPSIHSLAVDVVIDKLTSVGASVSPMELSVTMLLSILIISLVTRVVRPNFFTLTMLLIFKPVPFIFGTIGVVINTKTVGFIVFPETVVNIAVSVDEATPSVCFVVLPISFI
jgi:hypothetical protein